MAFYVINALEIGDLIKASIVDAATPEDAVKAWAQDRGLANGTALAIDASQVLQVPFSSPP
jgi:hypothetical protein